MQPLKVCLFLLTIQVLATACQTVKEPASSTSGYVTYDRMALWPSKTIPVCWETPDNISPADKSLVRTAVRAAYEKADFEFTGWVSCRPDAQGIRIGEATAADGFPKAAAFGAYLNGVRSGIKLEFRFDTFYPVCMSSEQRRRQCVAATAVHEFGHALGLRHEANRPDGQCKSFDQTGGRGEDQAVAVGAYDEKSIMNYCHLVGIYQQGGSHELSAGDIKTLDVYYSSAHLLPDYAGHCNARGGTWKGATEQCCNISPSGYDFMVSYRPCDPAQQCVFDRGTVVGQCCRFPLAGRANPSYAVCGF